MSPSRTPKSAPHKPQTPPGFSSAPTQDVDAVTSGLAAIYGKETPDARKQLFSLEKDKRRTWLILLIGAATFLAVLAAVAWAGFWWWTGSRTEEGLALSVEGPTDISLGQETTFKIHWKNEARDPIAAVEVRVVFPNDFAINAIEPQPTERANSGASFTVRLGSQAAGAEGAIDVRGVFSGSLGTQSAIQVIGTYRPATFNSEFEKLVTHPLTYTSSVLEGELSFPEKVLPGDKVEIRYIVTNTGTVDLEGLEARLTLPEGFVRDVEDTAELLEGRVARRMLPLIPAGTSSTVSVIGSFAATARGDVTVHAEAGRVAAGGAFAASEQTDRTLSVLAGDLALDVVVNGSGEGRSVSLGERQRVAVNYRNLSGVALSDVTLRFFVGRDPSVPVTGSAPPTVVDWNGLDDPQGSVRQGDTLVLTSVELPALADIPADAQGTLEFSVPLVSSLTAAGQGDAPLVVSAEATIAKVDGTQVNRTVRTEPIALRLQTDTRVAAVARYTSEEGAPVGSGPLPPVVGSGTTYRVEWTLTKSFHALERVTVSATLPSSVAWGGAVEVEAGELTYDADRRLVTWIVNRLPDDIHRALGSFNVTLTPSEADVGRFASLMGESRMEFTDATLGEPLLRTTPSLSTDLPSDEYAKGKGVVRRP